MDEEVPKWVTKPLQKVLVAFKRQGGQGHIADVRQATGAKAGDPYVRKLIAHGLMRQPTRDYVLTRDGYAMANLLISKGM